MHTTTLSTTVTSKFAPGDTIRYYSVNLRETIVRTVAHIGQTPYGGRPCYWFEGGTYGRLHVIDPKATFAAPFNVGDWITWGSGFETYRVESIDYAASTWTLTDRFRTGAYAPAEPVTPYIRTFKDTDYRIADAPKQRPARTTTITIEHSENGGAMNLSIPAAIRQVLEDPTAFGAVSKAEGTHSVTIHYGESAVDTKFTVSRS